MEPALKQRLWGAVILIALAVIFLPMLIQGPAPDSGVADVPLTMPNAPAGQYETRELPLVTPAEAPEGGAVGMTPSSASPDAADPARPQPATTAPAATASASQPVPLGEGGVSAPAALPAEAPAPAASLPAPAAGGDYAVNLGSFASAANAEGAVRALKQAKLPAYSEPATVNGRSGYRIRVGPYATRPDAEAARLRAQELPQGLRGSVVVLDAEPIAAAPKPAETKPAAPKPAVETKPAPPSTVQAPAPAKSAASGTGFAVQLAAFSKPADANALRDRLRAAGFSAFVEQVKTDKGPLSRVRVGPVVGRAEADQLKAQVKAKTGMDGIVRPHP
ncbi:sporulation protein [Luteimonas gilva]|uniref:Sporulation protein n=1 Tax=Luteimonas gilva TaxID=2572684 RepID=A0A4U5JVI0_9GAMM|nr:SPOR domain-containing protein [Luteimonas gilva]TKR33924.1 sporulation protein [Luteimonas gilva]